MKANSLKEEQLRGRRTKVVYLIDSLGRGGAQKSLSYLVAGLDKTRFEVIVVSLRNKNVVFRGDQPCEVITLGIEHPWEIHKVWRVYSVLRKNRPDILHCLLFYSNNVGRVLGRIAGVPIIFSSIRGTNRWKTWYHFLVEQAAFE